MKRKFENAVIMALLLCFALTTVNVNNPVILREGNVIRSTDYNDETGEYTVYCTDGNVNK